MINNLTEKQLAAQQLLSDLENARISLLEENYQLKLQPPNTTEEWIAKKTIINQDITEICRLKLQVIYNCF
jgi:hypothetical protein